MDQLQQDVRFALRSFARNPGFSALAVLTLALGVGANTAIFSVIDGVLLKPLDFKDPGRIVSISTSWRKSGLRGTVSAPDFHDWHDGASSFSTMAAYGGGETSVSAANAADYASAVRVTPGFFQVLGAEAQIGRLLTSDEEKASGDLAAVISHEFWMRRFGGQPDALGRAVAFGERTFTIVGVMPPSFHFPGRTDIWYAWAVVPETTSRSAHNYRVVGRLKDQVSVAQAQSDLTAIAARLEQAYPVTNEGTGVAVVPLRDQLVGDTRPTLYLLFGAVALVLLIACANVANLLLARATVRTSELAVRAALGASRLRLIGQLITESAMLALASAFAGTLLARWGVTALIAAAPAGLPRLVDVRLDARVLAFAVTVSLVASLLVGLVPALHASRVDLIGSLRQGGRGAQAGGRGGRLRAALVVTEVALAVALVVGAALLIRSFIALGRVELGFTADHVLVAETTVPTRDLDGARRATLFYASLLPRVSSVPGVTSVAGVRGLPGTSFHSNGGYWIEGGLRPEQSGIRAPQAVFTVVTPNYFHVMRIPIRRGRDFSDADRFDAPFVAIINDALAKRAFPDADPLGHRVQSGLDTPAFMTIVGIVGNVRQYDPSLPPAPELYLPYQQHPGYGTSLTLVARTAAEPMRVATAVQDTIRQARPDVPARVSTMGETLSTSVATPRFRTLLVGIFAAVALCLAVAGVYGVMAYSVGRRTSEIGVRIALGAASSNILALVMGQGLQLAAAGVAIGCALAWAVARVLRGMLFGVGSADPFVFSVVPVLLLATAAAACAVPALRAARVDPMRALRSD